MGLGDYSVSWVMRPSKTHCITYVKDSRFLWYFADSPIILLAVSQNYRIFVYLEKMKLKTLA